MAKQIKVFSGILNNISPGGSSVLYTVPAGRVAKITIGTLLISSGSSSSGSFIAAGITIAQNISGSTPFRTSSFNTVVGTSTSNILSPGAGQKVALVGAFGHIIDSEIYLMAADTVVFAAAGTVNSGIQYSFSVVEEF
jgi:hypothetical protein